MNFALRLASLLLAALCFTGCGPDFAFEDDLESFDIDLRLFGRPGPDELRSPYATGTQVHITAEADDRTSLRGFSLRSSDPSVFRIDGPGVQSVLATAVAPGTARLQLVDSSGDVVRSAAIEVRTPDAVQLHARGALVRGLPEEEARVERPAILVERAATFRVRYMAGDQMVHGQGLLSARALTEATVTTDESSFEKAEWVQIVPHEPGVHRVELLVDDAVIDTVEVEAVTDDAVARVELDFTEEDATEGSLVRVLARSFDSTGRPILGSPFDWSLRDAGVMGDGDLFDYAFDPAAESMLEVAGPNGTTAEALVHATNGTVTTSTVIGCSAAPGAGAAPLGVLSLFVLAGFALARRRTR